MIRWSVLGVLALGSAGVACATGGTLGDSDDTLGFDGGFGNASSDGAAPGGQTGAGGISGNGGAFPAGGGGGSSGGGSANAGGNSGNGSGGAPNAGGAGTSGGSGNAGGGVTAGGASPGGASGAGGGGISCSSGLKSCGGVCVTTSISNGCDEPGCNACPAPLNGTAVCNGGQCDFMCGTGYTKSGNICQAGPSCTDGKKNAAETDVDCGGGTCPPCDPGLNCDGDADCDRGPCEPPGVCGCTPMDCTEADSCAAAVSDGCGTDLDCSASCVGQAICYQDKCCTALTECPTTSCSPTVSDTCGGTMDCSANCKGTDVCFSDACCTPKTCSTLCGHANDTCGAFVDCPPCADGGPCQAATDCQSNACEGGRCVSCTDGQKNHGETDTDCGGPNCGDCASGKTCNGDSDCVSGHCCGGLFDFSSGCFGNSGKCGN